MTNQFSSINDSLTHKASKSVFWTVLSALSVSVLKFGTTMVLARLLMPKDFGIIGMATLVMGMINLFGNLGMGAAIIQKKDLKVEYLSTAYWTNFMVGAALTLIGIISAPFTALFFKEPELQNIIIFMSFGFLIANLASTHIVFFYRELQFKTLSIIEIISTFMRVVVILIFAFFGFGVWSMVLGMMTERIAKSLIIISLVKWRPLWMFDKAKFHELFHFGKNLYGESFVSYLNTNADYMLTGRFLGSTNLGFYNFAYNLPHLILTYMSENVLGVLYPLYCKVQGDLERIARGYLKTVQFISLISFPLLAGLFFVAADFTHLVYGVKWLPAVVPLKILCISSALLTVISANGSLCAALGKPQISFRWSLIKLPVTIVAIIIGSHWGINGVAWATAFMGVFSLIFVRLGLHLIDTNFRQYLFALWPAVGSTLIMLGAMFTIDNMAHYGELSMWLRFSLNVAIGASAYVLSMRFIYGQVFHDFLGFVRKMF